MWFVYPTIRILVMRRSAELELVSTTLLLPAAGSSRRGERIRGRRRSRPRGSSSCPHSHWTTPQRSQNWWWRWTRRVLGRGPQAAPHHLPAASPGPHRPRPPTRQAGRGVASTPRRAPIPPMVALNQDPQVPSLIPYRDRGFRVDATRPRQESRRRELRRLARTPARIAGMELSGRSVSQSSPGAACCRPAVTLAGRYGTIQS